MVNQGLWLKNPSGKVVQYRRVNDQIGYWETDEDEWRPTEHPVAMCARLTTAGWPPDLEPESIAGPYVGVPLEGRWTRAYWRAIETVALWCRAGHWPFTGRGRI